MCSSDLHVGDHVERIGEEGQRAEGEAADDLDREETRIGDEGEGEGATTGHDAPDHRVRRRSSRAASRAIIASTSARSLASPGGQPIGLTTSGTAASSTGRRSFEAW